MATLKAVKWQVGAGNDLRSKTLRNYGYGSLGCVVGVTAKLLE